MSRGNIEHSLTLAMPKKHAVIRSRPMAKPMERIGVHATAQHLLAIVRLFMHTLAAGGDLQAAHEEVEAECQRRILGVVHGVESTVLGREMGDEHKVRTVFLEGVLTDSALLFRRKVVLATVIRLAEVVLMI